MSWSWEGWSQSPGTGWWKWQGSNQEWWKTDEEESTDRHAAREQKDARAANCGGSSAVAESNGRSSTSNGAAAGAPPAAIAEQAASYTAVAADAGQEDTMAAPSSALPDPQEVIPYEVFRHFRNSLGTIGNTTRHSSTGEKSLSTAVILWVTGHFFSPTTRESELGRSYGAKGRIGPSTGTQ